MNQELSRNLKCIVLWNGLELWIENERINAVIQALDSGTQKFLKIDNEIINTAQIIGIFSPQMMEERTRLKNGQWKCHNREWHGKKESCKCIDSEIEKKENEYCKNYYKTNGYYPLDCWHSRNGRTHHES